MCIRDRIFDAFLIDGEEVIFTLLLKILDTQQAQILELYDMDLIEFMKSQMHQSCLKDHKIHELLDFEEVTEGFWCPPLCTWLPRRTDDPDPRTNHPMD